MADENPSDRDAGLRAAPPIQNDEQTDPFLQMNAGKMNLGGVTLFVAAIVLILSVVLYGLNGGNSGGTAAPAAPQTTHKG